MPATAEWFRQWFNAPYYHQLYFDEVEKEGTAFVQRLLDFLKPPAGSLILEAGCGKGTHCRMLAEKGFEVTGIDISFENVEEASRLAKGNVQFFQHDIRLPFWISYFHYALALSNAFGFYRTERENANAIRTISSSLKPRGFFVLDYLNTHYLEDHLVHQAEKQIGDVNFFITRWFDETHFYNKIVVEDDKLEEPLIYHEKFQKFSLGDLNDMLAFHKLQVQDVFGDYHFRDYDLRKSPRLIIIAKKIAW